MKDKVQPMNAIFSSAYIIFNGSFQSGSLDQCLLSVDNAATAEGSSRYQQAATAMQKANIAVELEGCRQRHAEALTA